MCPTAKLPRVLSVVALVTPLLLSCGRPREDAALNVASRGVEFLHRNGMVGKLWLHEIMGVGGALFDYDQDGDLDLYLRQSDAASGDGDRLYANRWREQGRVLFEDVSEVAGIGDLGYGMGVAVGDIDGDGWLDLYLSNYGPDIMLRNARGRFEQIDGPWMTESWSASASFLDLEPDGDLDLFVARYVDFTPARQVHCRAPDSMPDYCGPSSYSGLPDALYRNDGNLAWSDVSQAAGISSQAMAGLGVVALDLNDDRLTDIFVANDADPNQLWINQGDGRFVEEGVVRGVAVNADGRSEAGMGIAVDDVDDDGRLDLFLTHLASESHTLYVAQGNGQFEDQTARWGLGSPAISKTGFGVGFLYLNDDDERDLMIANGAVSIDAAQRAQGEALPLREPQQVLLKRGPRRFEPVHDPGGPLFESPMVGRGIAFGDLDDDGDTDFALMQNHGSPAIVLNEQQFTHPWIGLRLLQPGEGEAWVDALGASVALQVADDHVRVASYRRDGSYLSSNDPRLMFRLPRGASGPLARVVWPDGREQLFGPLELGQYHTLRYSAEKR